MRWLIICFTVGAAWLQTQAVLPFFAPLWWAPLALLAWHYGLRLWPSTGYWAVLRWGGLGLIALATGFYYAAWRADLRLADRVDPLWDGLSTPATGLVEGLPQATAYGWRFVLRVVQDENGVLPQRLQVMSASKWLATPPRGGDCLRLDLRVRPPHASQNPGVADIEGWLFERGIRGFATATGPIEFFNNCPSDLRAYVDALRHRLREGMLKRLTDAEGRAMPYAGVAIALAVGDQNAISDAQWRLFRMTGVTHLMSISGLHITLLSGLIYALVYAIWRQVTWLMLRVPAVKAAAIAGLLLAMAYTLLSGFGIPAQRTLYMIAVMVIGVWLSMAHSPSRVLAAALAIVVLIDPWAALSAGFWLSFMAVAALFYAGAGRLRPPRFWRSWALTQWVASLALLPLLLMLFHEFSLVSPLANTFAIPVISFLVVPLAMLSALLPWDGLATLTHSVIAAVMWGLEILAAWPQPVWHVGEAGGQALFLAAIGLIYLILPGAFPRRFLGLVLLLPLLWPTDDRPANGVLRVDTLDVGQGLAVVVSTARHTLLFDTGPAFESSDAGQRIVAPRLWAMGVRRLDGLIVSHADSDHSGGAASIEASFRPVWSLYGQPQAGSRQVRCVAGQTWQWDSVRFEVLHPPMHWADNPYFSNNDRSCVVKAESAWGSVLLVADIERLGELEMLENRREHLPSTALLVAHHGSRSSSSERWIAAVRPSQAILSVGRNNAFGHPHSEALGRYRDVGSRIWRTDQVGAIRLDFLPEGSFVRLWRDERRRYWHSSGCQRDHKNDCIGMA